MLDEYTAEYIGQNAEGMSIFKLSDPIEYTGITHHVAISVSRIFDPETFVFPCDKDGKALSKLEIIPGSCRGIHSPKEVFARMHFTLKED